MMRGDVVPKLGDVLANKYRVERVLGSGSMGVVVAAMHEGLGQLVALKLMRPTRATTHVMRERFLREARAAARLRSVHAVRVLDLGVLADESLYMVIELLEGKDCAVLLKENGPWRVEDAVACLLHACEAVGEAHARGVVHRDLKPANLFMTRDIFHVPCVKVLDFGISKVADAGLQLTQESQTLGSPLYMSPEQMRAPRDADARSDIWSLGITLYELLTGRTPFHADMIHVLWARVLRGEYPPLDEVRRDLPAGLSAVVDKCLRQNPEDRFRDVAALAYALEPYAPARARMYGERVSLVLGLPPIEEVIPDSEPPSQPFPVVEEEAEEETESLAITTQLSTETLDDTDAADNQRTGVFDGIAIAERGDVLLVVWRKMASLERLAFFLSCLREMLNRVEGDILILQILPADTSPSEQSAREGLMSRMKGAASRVRRIVTVFQGAELHLGELRSMLRATRKLLGRSDAKAVWGSTQEGIEIILEQASMRTPSKANLESTVAALTKALDVQSAT